MTLWLSAITTCWMYRKIYKNVQNLNKDEHLTNFTRSSALAFTYVASQKIQQSSNLETVRTSYYALLEPHLRYGVRGGTSNTKLSPQILKKSSWMSSRSQVPRQLLRSLQRTENSNSCISLHSINNPKSYLLRTNQTWIPRPAQYSERYKLSHPTSPYYQYLWKEAIIWILNTLLQSLTTPP